MSRSAAQPALAPPEHAAPIHRWADLLARQLAALETGDVEAFLSLAPESEAAAIAAAAAGEAEDARAVVACADLLASVQVRLRALRDAARGEIRDLDERAPAVRHYGPTLPSGSFDVRF